MEELEEGRDTGGAGRLVSAGETVFASSEVESASIEREKPACPAGTVRLSRAFSGVAFFTCSRATFP